MNQHIEALVDALIQCARNEPWTAAKKAAYRNTEAAKAALLAAYKQEWLPIESAPKDGTRILGLLPECQDHHETTEIVRWGKHNHVPLYGWIYRSDKLGFEDVDGCNPTHWMPLFREGV